MTDEDLTINDIFNKFELFYILIITIVGLIGNSISFLMFVFSKLRLEKTNLILAVLAAVDNGFLISLFFVTFRHFNFNLFDKSDFFCKITVYCSYVFSFLSGWLVVAFSLERLVAVYFPLKLTTICSKNKTHCILCFLFIFALMFYSFTFYTSGIEKHDNESNCVTIEKHFQVVTSIVLIDIVLATLLPFILITIFNLCIRYKLRKLPKLAVTMSIRRSTRQSESKLIIRSSEYNINKNLITFINSSSLSKKKSKKGQYKTYSESTKTLMMISLVFLILHFPLALNKVWYFVSENFMFNKQLNDSTTLALFDTKQFSTGNQSNYSAVYFQFESNEYEELFERVTCYIFYLNFSLNFFLYTYNGSKFRNIFLKLFRKNTNLKCIKEEKSYEFSRDRFSVINIYNN